MSKNFVREIDSIKNINKQEFYTNKANDLLSTKEHNYIRKETQEYHCLTDNIKQTKAANVRYTDTTANPNVNYNLLSVDNTQVPKTNTNTISASSLVEALEAKDEQLKKMKDEIEKINPKKFEGVINTSSNIDRTTFDGFITAKTIKKLTDEDFLVEFIFTGKLSFNNVSRKYIAYFDRTELYDCAVGFVPDVLDFTNYMTFNPDIYSNNIKLYKLIKSGELQFDFNGTQYPETISTTIIFTIKANHTEF